MKLFRTLTLTALVALVAGCASVARLEGEQAVNERMTVRLPQAWNKVQAPGQTRQPYEVWTQEGLALDQLRLWAGIRNGQPLAAPPPAPPGGKALQVPTFRAGMAPDQLASLFEVLYSFDGSQVQVTRLEPTTFAGEKGVRFELAIVRKRDEVQLSVVGWASVCKDELFALTYMAPRLGFFPRGRAGAEAAAASARIRG